MSGDVLGPTATDPCTHGLLSGQRLDPLPRFRAWSRRASPFSVSIPEPPRPDRAGKSLAVGVGRHLRSPVIALGRSLLGLGWIAVAAWPTAVLAGLSLDEAIARHRSLGAPSSGVATVAPTPIAIEDEDRDDVTAALGGLADDIPPLLPFEMLGEGGLRLRTHTTLAGGAVRARFGVAWQPGDSLPISFDGSAVSAALVGGRVYASVERRHWGPSWTGSLILDAGAQPIPAVGWRKSEATAVRTPWLAWLGPWSVDVFAGGLSQENGPQQAHLFGARIQIMPLPGLELAVSRTMQWGGNGRSESLGSFTAALIGHDNSDDAAGRSSEPGNQLGGFDARYTHAFGERHTVSIYGQAIGEDEAGGLPSHYLASVGADAAFVVDTTSVRLFVEHADTTLGGATGTPILGSAYRHSIYVDGYTQRGAPLGYPAGGDVRLTSIGAIVDAGTCSARLTFHHGDAYSTATLYPGGGRLSGVDAALAWQVDPSMRIGIEVVHWRDPLARSGGDSDARPDLVALLLSLTAPRVARRPFSPSTCAR